MSVKHTLLRILSVNILTFFAFGKTNNICNAEGQTNSNNKEIISLKPYEREYCQKNPCNSL